jgi:hypothetical protein
LRAGDAAATEALRKAARPQLDQALEPYVEAALESGGVFAGAEAAARRYATGGLADLRPRLTAHASAGALDAVFYYIAEEERAIRADPGGRAGPAVERVFGG